jgi:hypothetical protein
MDAVPDGENVPPMFGFFCGLSAAFSEVDVVIDEPILGAGGIL